MVNFSVDSEFSEDRTRICDNTHSVSLKLTCAVGSLTGEMVVLVGGRNGWQVATVCQPLPDKPVGTEQTAVGRGA